MDTVTKVSIGASIAIFAGLVIAAIVFNIHIEDGLAAVGFLFAVSLPLYIGYRIGEKRHNHRSTTELFIRIDRCKELLDQIEESLDESITKFQEWGRYLKDFEKEDEKSYYAEIALWKESGFDNGRLSAEYGQDISHLIKIRRNLLDNRYLL